jgi:hypothetical protein
VGQINSLPGSTIRVDKVVFKAGLAASVTEAGSKRKAGSVRFNGDVVKDPVYGAGIPPVAIDVRVGHRMKRVQIQP